MRVRLPVSSAIKEWLEAMRAENRVLKSELLATKVRQETSEEVTEQIRLQVTPLIQSASGDAVTR